MRSPGSISGAWGRISWVGGGFPKRALLAVVALAVLVASNLPGARAAASGSPPEPGPDAAAALRLRRALARALPGDSEAWPFWVDDQLLFVLRPAGGEPGRLAGDGVDADVMRRYPEASLYYLQRLMQAARRWSAAWPDPGIAISKVVLLVPGAPSVVATLPQDPGLADVAVVGLASYGHVWVDGQLHPPSKAAWRQAAESLAVDADRWHARYRPRASIGGAPDLSALLRAEALYEAAAELDPTYGRAASQLAAMWQRLRAAALFARGQALLGVHERLLRDADRRHNEVEQRREAFFVGEALTLVRASLSLDGDLVGAAAVAERLRRELAGRSEVAPDGRAELEARQQQEYEEGAQPLDLESATLEPESTAGRRVRFTGRVVSHVPAKLPGVAGLPILLVEDSSSAAGPLPGDAWILVEPVAADADQEAAMRRAMGFTGAWVHVAGELAGVRRVPAEVGGPVAVPRVLAAYVSARGT